MFYKVVLTAGLTFVTGVVAFTAYAYAAGGPMMGPSTHVSRPAFHGTTTTTRSPT